MIDDAVKQVRRAERTKVVPLRERVHGHVGHSVRLRAGLAEGHGMVRAHPEQRAMLFFAERPDPDHG